MRPYDASVMTAVVSTIMKLMTSNFYLTRTLVIRVMILSMKLMLVSVVWWWRRAWRFAFCSAPVSPGLLVVRVVLSRLSSCRLPLESVTVVFPSGARTFVCECAN